jgi:hypothetical protein
MTLGEVILDAVGKVEGIRHEKRRWNYDVALRSRIGVGDPWMVASHQLSSLKVPVGDGSSRTTIDRDSLLA